MGLTITYSLQANAPTAGEARRLVSELRRRAQRLPMKEVGPMLDLSGAECDYQRSKVAAHRWLLIQAIQQVRVGDHYSYDVIPTRVMAFTTWPGDGCAPANFGMCQYPARIVVPDRDRPGVRRTIDTGLTSWRWSSFCKTVYAGEPECGGAINFLRCHITLISLLDQARALGMTTAVNDPGEYWESRDPEVLLGAAVSEKAGLASFLARRRGEPESTLLDELVRYSALEGAAA